MRTSRQRRPQVELMESKTLLNGARVLHHETISAFVAPKTQPLSGTVTGTYSIVHVKKGSSTITISGSGSVKPIGLVTINETMPTGGVFTLSTPTTQLTLVAAKKGIVVIQLNGAAVPNATSHLTFTVLKNTIKNSHLTTSGQATLQLAQTSESKGHHAGTIKLTLNSGH